MKNQQQCNAYCCFLTLLLWNTQLGIFWCYFCCIADCSIDDSLLKVSSMSSSYNAIGEFYCQNGGTLVNQNDGQIASNSTVCLGTAQWDRANELECWYGT